MKNRTMGVSEEDCFNAVLRSGASSRRNLRPKTRDMNSVDAWTTRSARIALEKARDCRAVPMTNRKYYHHLRNASVSVCANFVQYCNCQSTDALLNDIKLTSLTSNLF